MLDQYSIPSSYSIETQQEVPLKILPHFQGAVEQQFAKKDFPRRNDASGPSSSSDRIGMAKHMLVVIRETLT